MCLCCNCLGHLDVLGELASHKRSLTHCQSSQGWASRCSVIDGFLLCLFACLLVGVVVCFLMYMYGWVIPFSPFLVYTHKVDA